LESKNTFSLTYSLNNFAMNILRCGIVTHVVLQFDCVGEGVTTSR